MAHRSPFRTLRRSVSFMAVALVVGACSPARTTLARLATDQDVMSGRRVVVVGTVVAFDDSDGGVDLILEDAAQNRVLLVPADVAKGFVGSRVEVTGMFEFDAARGRLLWVEAIAPPPDG